MLEQQLAMNVRTWGALRQHGLTEETALRLDFSYDAPTRGAAAKLVRLLRDETDYDVLEPMPSEGGFTVSGTTQETKITLATLHQWVDWMYAAGRQSEGCDFDGWGAQVPEQV